MRTLILFFILLSCSMPSHARAKRVVRPDSLYIKCCHGQAPTLPATIFRNGECCQVKWDNTSTEVEHEQAEMAVGTEYCVNGHVLGSDAWVVAKVRVVDEQSHPTIKARPLPLADVKLSGDNILTRNRDRDIERLLSLDLSQQIYNYHDCFGLPTDGMTVADGWDSPTTKLKGHGTGHYLSALALAYTCANEAQRPLLLKRISTIVSTMRQCQERTFTWCDSLGRYFEARDVAPEAKLKTMGGKWSDFDRYKEDYRHYGYGYVNAIPPQHLTLIEAYRPYNNEDWVWAPYYTVHKQLAGLADVAEYVDDRQVSDMALAVARDMGLWVWNRLHYRTYVERKGTREERRTRPGNRFEMWNMYIAGEVGGMQEVLARLASMTNDTDQRDRLTEAASFFDAPAFYDPLSKNIDDIRTRHANQHIPMITGALRLYSQTGEQYYYDVAHNFWHLLQGRYTYATGGVGNGEMFRQPYSQMVSMLPNANINETCCAYNLAKLSRDLNQYNPMDAKYMDYYEKLLYNQLVGSLSPDHWAVTYQYAVGLDASKPFGNETPQSTCCGGTGVENHVRYQEATYYSQGDTLWVCLYLPTEAEWRSNGMHISMQGQWPSEKMKIRPTGGRATVMLRVPYWATKDFDIQLNGRSVKKNYTPCSYVEIPARQWTKRDVIEVRMPFARHLSYGPDPVDGWWVATVMNGPLAMVTTDATSWENAHVDSVKTFVPDYSFTEHGTHYLRVNRLASYHGEQLQVTALAQALSIARQRWEDGSAWAPHALRRMVEQMKQGETVLANTSAKQEEIDSITSVLNATLNIMRPSTLAEPEDVEALQQRVANIRNNNPSPSSQLSEDLKYADMVIRYVLDGSGTHDLISKATQRLTKY